MTYEKEIDVDLFNKEQQEELLWDLLDYWEYLYDTWKIDFSDRDYEMWRDEQVAREYEMELELN